MQCVKLSVTVKFCLEDKYRSKTKLKRIRSVIKDWIKADAKRGICTVHVEVDNPADAVMKKHRVPPVKLVDGKTTASEIKRVVDALWKPLSPQYLVLFGGDDIVPMFRVDHPFDDRLGGNQRSADWSQEEVLTDNPYASSLPFRSKNRRSLRWTNSNRRSYLVPDRIIGRIPDRIGSQDPTWFVGYLTTAKEWEAIPVGRYTETYAICSYEERQAAEKCMKYIARPDAKLLASPPAKDSWRSARERLSARLHMIKCHGSPRHPEFFGKRSNDTADAITSATLIRRVKSATVVGTTCCYGAHIFSPREASDRMSKACAKELNAKPKLGLKVLARGPRAKPKRGGWPLASTYLREGALGFVGATITTFAGNSKMNWADWIVAGYLNSILGGASIGRAFLESKQDYSRWINQQGQSHGPEDDMTLLAYVLLGDPSITPVTYRSLKPGPTIDFAKIDLATEELRQRRVARAQIARQIRKLLPTRWSGATLG